MWFYPNTSKIGTSPTMGISPTSSPKPISMVATTTQRPSSPKPTMIRPSSP